MGIESLGEIFKDRRTPQQKRIDKIKGITFTIVVGGALLTVFVAGVIHIFHWIAG